MKKALVIAVSAVILFSGCGSSGTQSDAPTEASTEAVEENVAENKAETQDTEETSSTALSVMWQSNISPTKS